MNIQQMVDNDKRIRQEIQQLVDSREKLNQSISTLIKELSALNDCVEKHVRELFIAEWEKAFPNLIFSASFVANGVYFYSVEGKDSIVYYPTEEHGWVVTNNSESFSVENPLMQYCILSDFLNAFAAKYPGVLTEVCGYKMP